MLFWIEVIMLVFLGGFSEARKLIQRRREMRRVNDQPEAVVVWPCKICGRYPKVTDQGMRWYGKIYPNWWIGCWHSDKETWDDGDDVRYICTTDNPRTANIQTYRRAVRQWNEQHGTLDETELKFARLKK